MISGVNWFRNAQMASRAALTANQQLNTCSNRRRSSKSPSAPAGRVKRKKGSVLAVDIMESKRADAPFEFIAQVAAVS